MQAARGTSLSPDSGPTTHTSVRLFAIVAVLTLAVDQVSKYLAVERLQNRAPVELIPNVLSLAFYRNAGAALGTGTGFTVVQSIIAIVVCVAVVRIATRLRDRGWAIGLGLLLAGALGNLADRLFRQPSPFKGHVVDFIDYGVFIGNVADIALTLAAIVIVWRTWRGVSIDGTREAR